MARPQSACTIIVNFHQNPEKLALLDYYLFYNPYVARWRDWGMESHVPDSRKLIKVSQRAILQAPESGLPNSLLYTCVCWLHRLPRSWTPPLTFPGSITFPTSSFRPPWRRPCFSRALGKPPSLYQSFFLSLTSPDRIKVLHSKGPTCLLRPPPDTEHSTGYHTLLNGWGKRIF